MKHPLLRFTLATVMTAAALMFPTVGRAQSSQIWSNDSGDGLWNQGGGVASDNVTPTGNNWNGNAWNGNDDDAVFNAGAAGTITVDNTGIGGPVTVDSMTFNSGDFTFTGDVLTENAFTRQNYEASTQASPNVYPGSETFITANNAANVTFSNQIVLSDLGENQQDYVTNNSSGNITFENIDFGPYTIENGVTPNPDNPIPGTPYAQATTIRRINLNDYGTGAIILDGAYTASAGYGGQIDFTGGTGTYDITANATFTGLAANVMNFYGGTLNIANSTFTSAQTIGIGGPDAATKVINLQGAQTIAMSVYNSEKYGSHPQPDGVVTYGTLNINQGTADTSTWSGGIGDDGSNLNTSAVAGGRLIVSGNIYGGGPMGIMTTGAGTVVLASATGNAYSIDDGQGFLAPTSTVNADLQSGTTLITNTSGSAFGTASFANNYALYASTGNGNPNNDYIYGTVHIEAGATLGGSGYTGVQTVGTGPQRNVPVTLYQVVIAESATSVIAPGDKGQANLGIAPSMATLHLIGGVQALNGLTMDFKLGTPGASDALDLGAGEFTLSGVVTVNLTAFDGTFAPGAAETFVLASGTGVWSDAGATFNFTPPAGDQVLSYMFDAIHDQFDVTVAVPEPSTYALIGLALLVLIGSGKLRKLNV